MIGFLLLLLNGTVIDICAYPLVPLALVAPFAGVTIAFSTLLVWSGLIVARQPLDSQQCAAIAAVSIGVVAISSAGPHSSAELTEATAPVLFFDRQFVSFMSLNAIVLFGAVGAWIRHELTHGNKAISNGPLVVLLAVGSASGSAFLQLFIKVVGTAFQQRSNSDIFFAPHVIISILGILVLAPLQLTMLNGVLAKSKATFAVPLYQTCLCCL